MPEQKILRVQAREGLGKGANRKLHEKGLVPGIFYSALGGNAPIQLEEQALLKHCQHIGKTNIFTLEIEKDGKIDSYQTLVWEVKRHPFKRMLQHFDLFGINPDKKIKIKIPLEFTGTAKGTKEGGKLEIFRDHLIVLCKPTDLPSKITIDISNLGINQDLRAQDITLPHGVIRYFTNNYAIVAVSSGRSTTDEEDSKK